MSVRYVTVAKYAAESGYSEKAIQNKIDTGVWTEGQQWRQAPDGRRLIDIEGVERWVEGQQVRSRPGRAA